MNIFEVFFNGLIFMLDLFKNVYWNLGLISLIILYHLLLYYIRDKKYIKNYHNFQDPESISSDQLKSLPLVNIIIPAWKEGQLFKKCLESIESLKYPNIKVIINAGGNQETLDIVDYFKNYQNFIILHQTGGSIRPSLGKIRALNECIEYVKEGIAYFIDADSYLDDKILIRMIFPIINLNENIVSGGVRPLKDQEEIDLVKYLQINKAANFKNKWIRYQSKALYAGQNTAMKYEVLKAINKFSEGNIYATDRSMGMDIANKNFKIYRLKHYESKIYVDYPSNIKSLIHHKLIWLENFLLYSSQKKKKNFLKIILNYFNSLIIVLFPFLILVHFGLFVIGSLFFLNSYLKKIRKYKFFKNTTNHQTFDDFSFRFFIKLVFYIFLDSIIYVIVPFHLIYFTYKLKKKKSQY